MLLRQRLQELDRGGTPGERRPPRLVRQRHADVGAGPAGQRLHGVELQRRQVVEPVQEHRPAAPGRRPLAQRVERRTGEPLGVARAEALEPAVVGRVERRELLGVGRRAPGRRPRPQRPGEPRRAHERALELLEQLPGRSREAGGARRLGQHAHGDGAHRRLHHPVPRHGAQRAATDARRRRDRPREAAERDDLGAEHDPVGGELAAVVVDVRPRRHDEQRLARERRAEALEDGAGLGGVRGSGDQCERHGPHRVARAPDSIAGDAAPARQSATGIARQAAPAR